MSNVYVSEPPCTAKAILHTTYGPVEVELWGKECPKTCRRWLTLALRGNYNGACFDRIVPGFCIQAGAIRDDQEDLVPKEFHTRLKFTRRGLLGAVSLDDDLSESDKATNRKGSNHPNQFFITLAAAPELTSQMTVFGRVVGDTLFNVVRIGDVAVDEEDKPMFEIRIVRVDVTQNPWDDLYTPTTETSKASSNASSLQSTKEKRAALLSFGSGVAATASIASSKPVKVADELVKDGLDELRRAKEAKLEALRAQVGSLQEVLAKPLTPATSKDVAKTDAPVKETKVSKVQAMRAQFRTKPGVILGKREASESAAVETLLTLNSFRARLQREKQPEAEVDIAETKKAIELCKLHGLANCASCRDTFGLAKINGDEDSKLQLHRLVFDRAEQDHQIRRDLDQLVVIDPQAEVDRARKRAASKMF